MAIAVEEEMKGIAQAKHAEHVGELLEASRQIAPILIEDAVVIGQETIFSIYHKQADIGFFDSLK